MLQWIIVAVLVYAIYYLVNKYEKKIDSLNELIELNRSEILTNKELIEKNKKLIEENKKKIESAKAEKKK